MPRVYCDLPNASELIGGIKFDLVEGRRLSEEIDDAQAARLASIPGYELVEEDEEALSAAAEKAAKEAAEKAAAAKAAAEKAKAEKKPAAKKAAADKSAEKPAEPVVPKEGDKPADGAPESKTETDDKGVF